jgi:hypothetical protein
LYFINFCFIAGLRPRTAVAERLATMCVLPLLLAGVLGAPSQHEQLANYLRGLLVDGTLKESQSTKYTAEIIDAVRFLWFVLCRPLCVILYHLPSVSILSDKYQFLHDAAHLRSTTVSFSIFYGKWLSAPT